MNIVDKVKEIGYDRCGKCPAYWHSVDYWGEAEDGCSIHRDHLEFCPLSFLPQAVMKPYVKYKLKQEEKYWDKFYEDKQKEWEIEEKEVTHEQSRRD